MYNRLLIDSSGFMVVDNIKKHCERAHSGEILTLAIS